MDLVLNMYLKKEIEKLKLDNRDLVSELQKSVITNSKMDECDDSTSDYKDAEYF